MKFRTTYLWFFSFPVLVGCSSGVRDLDFVSKRFTVTYNIDSTRGIDTTNLDNLTNASAIYTFNEDGKGTNHVRTGLLSRDTPFTWKVQADSLYINNTRYSVQKDVKGFILRSDSAKVFLSIQP